MLFVDAMGDGRAGQADIDGTGPEISACMVLQNSKCIIYLRLVFCNLRQWARLKYLNNVLHVDNLVLFGMMECKQRPIEQIKQG